MTSKPNKCTQPEHRRRYRGPMGPLEVLLLTNDLFTLSKALGVSEKIIADWTAGRKRPTLLQVGQIYEIAAAGEDAINEAVD